MFLKRVKNFKRIVVRTPSLFALPAVLMFAAACTIARPAPLTAQVAGRASGFRIVVSLADRHLWVLGADGDTLRSAIAAIGVCRTLHYRAQAWTFQTPRGTRTVLRKEADPVWVPPEWFYVQAAEENDLKLARVSMTHAVMLADGRRLEVRHGMVGVAGADSTFDSLPIDEHIVFDNTLFIPPIGTQNRRVDGALGKYRLDLGNGYLLHGTPDKTSIGTAATHGCIRLGDDDIQWLYENVPVGTRVYI